MIMARLLLLSRPIMCKSRPDKASQFLANGNPSFTPVEDEIQPFSRCARRLFCLSYHARVCRLCTAAASKHDNVEQPFWRFRRRALPHRLLKSPPPPLDVSQMLEYRGLVTNNDRYPVSPGCPLGAKWRERVSKVHHAKHRFPQSV